MRTKALVTLIALTALCLVGCARPSPTPTPVPSPSPTPVVLPSPTPAPFPLTLVDDAGREVHIPSPPQRIVSLAPSNTEILFALGLGDKVVGVDDFSDYPPEVKDIPKERRVGGMELNFELIVSLKPDLVVAAGITSPDQIRKLEELGLTVLALGTPKDIEGVMEDIELVGKATGAEEAARRLRQQMEQRVREVEEKVASAKTRPLVFFELDATDPAKPYTPGPGSFIDVLIRMAGGENVAAEAKTEWAQLSIEEIVARNPDIIILGDANWGVTPEAVKERPGWEALKAVREGAIYPIDDNLVSRPGPRIVEGLEALARLIHPELFP